MDMTPTKNSFELLGGLGGYMAGSQDARITDQQNLQLLIQALSSQKQNLENQRYEQMTPLELAIKGLEANRANAMNTSENVNQYVTGQLGSFLEQSSKGKLSNATLESSIKETNAGNAAKTNASRLKELITGIDLLKSYGPLGAMQRGVDSNLVQQLQGQDIDSVRNEVMARLVDAPEHRMALEKVGAETAGHLANTNLHGQYSLMAARIHNAAKSSSEKANEVLSDMVMIASGGEPIGAEVKAMYNKVERKTMQQIAKAYVDKMTNMKSTIAAAGQAQAGADKRNLAESAGVIPPRSVRGTIRLPSGGTATVTPTE
jgi:hypothetical protein